MIISAGTRVAGSCVDLSGEYEATTLVKGRPEEGIDALLDDGTRVTIFPNPTQTFALWDRMKKERMTMSEHLNDSNFKSFLSEVFSCLLGRKSHPAVARRVTLSTHAGYRRAIVESKKAGVLVLVRRRQGAVADLFVAEACCTNKACWKCTGSGLHLTRTGIVFTLTGKTVEITNN